MAAKKETEGLYGYPVTEFKGPNGETATVTSAIMEHNLRAAGYAPKDPKKAPTQEDVTQAAAKSAEADNTAPAK